MPESVLVQVGQCGNQIGFNFWSSLLQEYTCHFNELYEPDFSQFLKLKRSAMFSYKKSLEEDYTARGILIDMEEGVINVGRKSSVGNLFLKNQILTDVSGSGNNWAVGHLHYGQKYSSDLEELFRVQAEDCNNLEAFQFVFSLGGGTGSGLGTYALEVLANFYPKVLRMVYGIFPSDVDDVITSPYNAALSNSKLLEHADIVVPFENNAIERIYTRLESNKFIRKKMAGSPKKVRVSDPKAFDKLNSLIATTMLDCSSTSRYRAVSNKSLKELVMNVLPGEYMLYAIPSIAPVLPSDDASIERLFNEVFSDNNALFGCCRPQRRRFCGITVFARGKKLNSTVVQNNLKRLEKVVRFVGWANGNIQHGQCQISSAENNASLVMLANTSSVIHRFQLMKIRLEKMYEKKAHLHHFLNEDQHVKHSIDVALNKLDLVVKNYQELEKTQTVRVLPSII